MSFQADTRCDCTVRQAVNFGDRASHLSVDILLFHYTGMESGQGAIDWLCCEESGVSCHYVVEEDGAIWQLVPEENRAWHAGQSSWQGECDTNSRSIGIEIVNPGHEYGYPEFPGKQIKAVMELSADILSRHDIPARNVLAHSDVAPGRKRDPGEQFPWRLLYENGIGHWVPESDLGLDRRYRQGDNGESIAAMQALLALYGYGCRISGDFDQQTFDCVTSFQRHFRQSKVDGIADEVTLSTLDSLIRNLGH